MGPRPAINGDRRHLGVVIAAGGVVCVASAGTFPRWWSDPAENATRGPTIGLSSLLNAIGGLLLALAVLGVRLRHLQVGALFTAGNLAALGLARTVGLFGFVDAFTTPLVPTALVVEFAGVVVLATTAVIARRVRRSG
jgi:drug/metabolite transporter (DMT)-like permease